jgi:hypothetical protein
VGTGRLAVALAFAALLVPSTAPGAVLVPAGHQRAVKLVRPGRHVHARRLPALNALPRSERAIMLAKAAARVRAAREAHAAGPAAHAAAAAAFAPPFTGLVQTGLGAGDALLGAPPDTTGSIGPDDYVEEVNDAVAVFRRSDLTRVAGPVPNEVFMRSPFPTFVSDPQMQWDQRGSRWVYLAVAFSLNFQTFQPSGPNYLLYGFSKSSDPTDLSAGWCHYRSEERRVGKEC